MYNRTDIILRNAVGSGMIEDAQGHIDYDESGSGPTVVLVPGSCSTGAGWRPVMAAWNGQFRCVTTSLLGYGGTVERRTTDDPGIAHEAIVLEAVIRRAGGCAHLVGHSFGGLVSLAVALRKNASLASLTIVEAPAVGILQDRREEQHCRAIRDMTQSYFADYERGNSEAIAAMIDFYGGAGTFAAWPQRARAYATQTTPVNILDWSSAYGFAPSAKELASIEIPVLVVRGGASHPAVQRANELLADGVRNAALATISTAAHFSIATHPDVVARLISEHVRNAQLER